MAASVGCGGGSGGEPVEAIVYAETTMLGGKDVSKRIDDTFVDLIRAQSGVKRAIPRMNLSAPASGKALWGEQSFEWEVGGFCDGVSADVMSPEPWANLFQDWEVAALEQSPMPCGPAPTRSCESSDYYCDGRDNVCRHRVPVVISPTLLKLYNDSLSGRHRLPKVSAGQVLSERALFDIHLGYSRSSSAEVAVDKQRIVGAMLVGVSEHAQPIGMTVPLPYVERWIRELLDYPARGYSEVTVLLESSAALKRFEAWLNKQHGFKLRTDDKSSARRMLGIGLD